MSEPARAEISLKIAEKLAGGTTALIDSCRQELPQVKKAPKKPATHLPDLAHGVNTELHGASNLVKLVHTADKGRFIVANNGIQTGDVVLCENPVAACLLPNFYGSHCHNCFER